MNIQDLTLCKGILCLASLSAVVSNASKSYAEEQVPKQFQYAFQEIKVLRASAEEPLLDHVSVNKADEYLLAGATVWTKQKKCISCHTNGSYLLLRPALTNVLGEPDKNIRDFYLSVLDKRESEDPEKLKHKGVTPLRNRVPRRRPCGVGCTRHG